MAMIDYASLSPAAARRDGRNSFAGIRAFFHDFLVKVLDPYRPELHYMRGPGPACRAKQAAALRSAH
jgi:hypothetical protein